MLGGTEVCWDTVAGSCIVAHTAVSILYYYFSAMYMLKRQHTHIHNTQKLL